MIAAPPPAASQQPRRPRLADALAIAALLALAFAVMSPTLRLPHAWSILYDWRYFEAMEEVFRRSVVDFGEAPLWNPYACGGEVGIANPQSTALAPTFLLSVLFDTPFGLKLALLFYLAAAMHGGFVLARAQGISTAGALAAGASFGGSGWFAMHLSTGHINFAGAAFYPYLVVCYLRAVDEPGRPAGWIFAIPGGALIAWMAALGGTYTVPMAVILLGALAATDAVLRRSMRPVGWVVLVGVFALLIGAARFLPLLEFVRDHPRHVPEKDGNNLFDVARMFLFWWQRLSPVGGHVYWWHEYCCHLPYLALLLAAVAAMHKSPALVERRRLLPLGLFLAWSVVDVIPGVGTWLTRHVLLYRDAYHLLGVYALFRLTWGTPHFRFMPVVVVALGIVAGVGWPHGPWWLVRMLPVYRDLRVPARYLVVVALFGALFAGRGLDLAVEWVRARRGSRLAGRFLVAATVVVVADAGAFSYLAYSESMFNYQNQPPRPLPPFHQISSEWRDMMVGIIGGHGVLRCDEEAPLQRGELDPGDVDQVRLLDPSAGSARLVRWTPNTLTVETDLVRPTVVMVNENWNEHWTVESPPSGAATVEVQALAGRLAARVSTVGRARFVLRYRPRSFVVGRAVSLVVIPLALLAFAVGLWVRARAASRP